MSAMSVTPFAFFLMFMHLASPQAFENCTIQVVHVDQGGSTTKTRNLISTVLSKQAAVQEPVIIRGGVSVWDAAGVAARLTKDHGKVQLPIRDSLEQAWFGWVDTSQKASLASALKAVTSNGTNGSQFYFAKDEAFADRLLQKIDWDDLFGGDAKSWRHPQSKIVSIGGPDDGLPFHVHGDALLGLVSGVKQWMLVPPADMTNELLQVSANPSKWLQRLNQQVARPPVESLQVCTQKAGDLFYVPQLWWHATVNAGKHPDVTFGLGGQMETLVDLMLDATRSQGIATVHRMVLGSSDKDESDRLSNLLMVWNEFPSFIRSSWALLQFMRDHSDPITVRAVLKVAAERLRHFVSLNDDLSNRTKAMLFQTLADVVAQDGKSSSPALFKDCIALYKESKRFDPNFPAHVWHNFAYALLQTRAEHDNKTLKQIQKMLWKALQLSPGYDRSIEALEGLGMPLPPASRRGKGKSEL